MQTIRAIAQIIFLKIQAFIAKTPFVKVDTITFFKRTKHFFVMRTIFKARCRTRLILKSVFNFATCRIRRTAQAQTSFDVLLCFINKCNHFILLSKLQNGIAQKKNNKNFGLVFLPYHKKTSRKKSERLFA